MKPFPQKNDTPWQAGLTALPLLGGAVLAVMLGCTRAQYRQSADRDAYCLVETRKIDPRWDVPSRPVEPDPASRMHFEANVDCAPKPADDSAAKLWMDCPDGYDNTHYYSQIATDERAESPAWLEYLPRNENNRIHLTLPLAHDLALLHSRDYQTQFETVYLSALSLSGSRFEFETQWFGGLGTNFVATGDDLGGQRLLDVSDRLGFGRNLAGGGQFATSILNNLFWDFGTSGVQGGSASLVTTFTQPLLRGAFRHVRLENLTQSERNLLYMVRDFARFRRLFYLDVTNSYLNLLTQVQAIRNLRTNVKNLRLSLDEYELYIELGIVSPVEVDQVYQDYQSGRLSLLAAEQSLAQSLDQFKFQLGLPPWVPFEIDESLLEPFELVDPQLEALQDDAQQLYQELVQFLPPERAPKEALLRGLDSYVELQERVAESLPGLRQELTRWLDRLEEAGRRNLSADDRLDVQQQRTIATRIGQGLEELAERLQQRDEVIANLEQKIAEYDPQLEQLPAPVETPESDEQENSREPNAWEVLLDVVGKDLREEISELFVAQTQIRLFLIDIDAIDLPEQTAIVHAHQNRLDLMNGKAQVMDAFRRVEVAADALESELNLTGQVGLGSDPGVNNAFRLDSSANTYRVGVQFDGPLNRRLERNTYRATQIAYQQARRGYVAQRDGVANEVRSVLRQLKLRRLNFQIARQQLVAATRQVDQAQIALRTSNTADSNLTLFLLQALDQLVGAKNNLISEWVRYRIEKIRLFTTLELLYLDEAGQWTNEDEGLEPLIRGPIINSDYFPRPWMQETPNSARDAENPQQGPAAEQLPRPPEAADSLGRTAPTHSPTSNKPLPIQSDVPLVGAEPPKVKTAKAPNYGAQGDHQREVSQPPAGENSLKLMPSIPYTFDFDSQ